MSGKISLGAKGPKNKSRGGSNFPFLRQKVGLIPVSIHFPNGCIIIILYFDSQFQNFIHTKVMIELHLFFRCTDTWKCISKLPDIISEQCRGGIYYSSYVLPREMEKLSAIMFKIKYYSTFSRRILLGDARRLD